MQVSGHRTRSFFDRYDVTSEGDPKVAAVKVADYLWPQDGHNLGHSIKEKAIPSNNSASKSAG
jgi:hypothetical protein